MIPAQIPAYKDPVHRFLAIRVLRSAAFRDGLAPGIRGELCESVRSYA
jgi:hypothetical protein